MEKKKLKLVNIQMNNKQKVLNFTNPQRNANKTIR